MIKKNPNWSKEQHQAFTEIVKKNKGHCPCSLVVDETTVCPCKEFREQEVGECHCGRYIKEEQ